MHLRPCPSCDRHVTAETTRCPFCDASLARHPHEPVAISGRLGRAAVMAFAVAACHDDAAPKETVTVPSVVASATPSVAVPSVAVSSVTAQPVASAVPSASAAPSASAVASATPDAGKPKVVTTATATATWRNIAKPYGAPPARDRRV